MIPAARRRRGQPHDTLRLTIGSLVLCALTVTGCTEASQEGPTVPSASSSTADTSPPTAELPQRPEIEKPMAPEGIDDEGNDAAMDAAIYFLEIFNYATATGDVDDFADLSTESCKFCADTVENLDGVYTVGGWRTGGNVTHGNPWTYTDLATPELVPVIMDATRHEVQTFDQSNELVGVHEPIEMLLELSMARDQDRWLVEAVKIERK